MFEREWHRDVLRILESLDAALLAQTGFLFAGGTRLVLELQSSILDRSASSHHTAQGSIMRVFIVSPSPQLAHWRRRLAPAAVCAGLALLCPPPAPADWLVTREGHRIETDGSWKVKGRIVVYTDPGGTLSSLRLGEVDLEASEAASEEPAAPSPAAKKPAKKSVERRKPVLVLTDADIPRGVETGSAAEIEPVLVMYSTDWCGVCRRARKLLADLGADYVEKDIEKSAEARREYMTLFGSNVRVPGFDYDGESFTGLRPAILERWAGEMKARKRPVAEDRDR